MINGKTYLVLIWKSQINLKHIQKSQILYMQKSFEIHQSSKVWVKNADQSFGLGRYRY
jgi:hypothetical protein